MARQKSTNYEIGIKADHGTWRLNAAAFYMDITDIQLVKIVGNLFLTDNADKAHSLGLELEGTWLPVQGLELSAGLSLMRARYDDFDLGTVQLDGKHMEEAPHSFPAPFRKLSSSRRTVWAAGCPQYGQYLLL